MTIRDIWAIMAKLSARHAAIAQPVERILGKDEVASSNLASSSNPNRKVRVFLFWVNNIASLLFKTELIIPDAKKLYALMS